MILFLLFYIAFVVTFIGVLLMVFSFGALVKIDNMVSSLVTCVIEENYPPSPNPSGSSSMPN